MTNSLRQLALAACLSPLVASGTWDAHASVFGLAPGDYAITFDIGDDGSIEGSGTFRIGADKVTAFDVVFPGISLQCTVCDVLVSIPDVVTQNIPTQFVIQDAGPELVVLGMLNSNFALQVKDFSNVVDGTWAATPESSVATPASMSLLLLSLGAVGLGRRGGSRDRSRLFSGATA